MKKVVLYLLLILCLFGLVGCKRKEISIDIEDISVNTMLVRTNGELQVAFVEAFDKNYYRLSELEEFVKQEVDVYNQKSGGNVVKIENLNIKDGNAVMLLTFSGMQHYAGFNEAWAAYFNSGANSLEEAPDTLVSTKDGSYIDKNNILQTNGYKILAVKEAFDIIVDGSIKYHTKNAFYIDKHKIQSKAEELTVVVFKP